MKTELLKTTVLTLSVLTNVGCALSVDGTQLSRFGAAPTIGLETLQSLPRSAWRIDDRNRAYVRQRKVAFSGWCSRGVQAVQAYVSGSPVGKAVPCSMSGAFEWKGDMVDGEYQLVFKPVFRNDSVLSDGEIEQTVVVASVPPPAPVIVTNDGRSINTLAASVELRGEVQGEATSVVTTGEGSLWVSIEAKTFSYQADLAQGETSLLSFYATDFAGNLSDPTRIQVSRSGAAWVDGMSFVPMTETALRSSDQGDSEMLAASMAPILSGYDIASSMGKFALTGAPALWLFSVSGN